MAQPVVAADAWRASGCFSIASGPARLHSAFGMTPHPSLLLLALLLAGCSPDNRPSAASADTKLREALIGTWVREGNGMLNLAADGSFSARWTNAHSSLVWIWAYEGSWKVTNGACVTALTNSQSWGTTNRQTVGSLDTWHVISLEHGELVWECNSQTNTLRRVK
jgi:hypothetical protein